MKAFGEMYSCLGKDGCKLDYLCFELLGRR
uniref:Uncharacterized protein n=1 Tax=Rhizophora mucronata TaxID=61149 RepID=A0A2P2PBJ4_RHIMU